MTGWHEDQSIWQEGDQGQGRGWSLQTQEIGPPNFESIYIRFILSYCIIFIILIITQIDISIASTLYLYICIVFITFDHCF